MISMRRKSGIGEVGDARPLDVVLKTNLFGLRGPASSRKPLQPNAPFQTVAAINMNVCFSWLHFISSFSVGGGFSLRMCGRIVAHTGSSGTCLAESECT